jgi:hypothetical protein
VVFTVKARVSTPGMDRLSGACQRGSVEWYQAVRWVDRYVQAAAQRAANEAIDKLDIADPQQWDLLRPEMIKFCSVDFPYVSIPITAFV